MTTKYINFIPVKENTERKPQRCLPPKASRTLRERFSFVGKAIIAELDYISRPRTHYAHYAKVLEAKRQMGLINY